MERSTQILSVFPSEQRRVLFVNGFPDLKCGHILKLILRYQAYFFSTNRHKFITSGNLI